MKKRFSSQVMMQKIHQHPVYKAKYKSERKLAVQCGFDSTVFFRLKHNKPSRTDTLIDISEALGISLVELVEMGMTQHSHLWNQCRNPFD